MRSLDMDDVKIEYIDQEHINISIDGISHIHIVPSDSLTFEKLDVLFKDLNLKSKIKEIIDYEFKYDKKLLYKVFENNEFYFRLINKYEINTNERLYKIESLGHSTGVYKEGINLDKIIVSSEDLFEKLLLVLNEEEARKLTDDIKYGKYINNQDLINYLVNKGLDKYEISCIISPNLSSLCNNIYAFLYR